MQVSTLLWWIIWIIYTFRAKLLERESVVSWDQVLTVAVWKAWYRVVASISKSDDRVDKVLPYSYQKTPTMASVDGNRRRHAPRGSLDACTVCDADVHPLSQALRSCRVESEGFGAASVGILPDESLGSNHTTAGRSQTIWRNRRFF